ncbi:nucleotidyltransferase family protein [Jannaschia seohaensis]|uniref:MurNAc alpha-1-phosphate uridylyltransferase n=1 Tax=Jannaschia seohaensis TaxID=475081 RepID=A0A2Y9A2S2_9RHOB|nr:nucleotidyltransferase family protein [Jannaschia seohaensis]PWJ22227.1 MurNAc alpha-1-phosphate uridylyltransferase [Jannaschia seohaensis]SSA38505.1 MurNAc alpha-1-phosphate uridylyltransferase [Jannaschia seohaensis]
MIATMVFAAGHGTRMRPLTDTRPKALIEVAGRPLIEHALEQVAGPGPRAVNAHAHAALLRAHLADRPGLTFIEEPVLLETGGGLRNALPVLGDGPVLTMNADAVWTGPRARDTLLAHWDPARMDGLLLMIPPDRALGQAGGSFSLDPDGRLVRDRAGLVYTGAGIVKTEGLAAFADPVFSLRELWFAMLAEGRLSGCVHPGQWADVGTPDGIALAEAMLDRAA